MKKRRSALTGILTLALLLPGCGSDKEKKIKKLEKRLKDSREETNRLKKRVESLKVEEGKLQERITNAKQKVSATKKEYGERIKATQQEMFELAKARAEIEQRGKILKSLSDHFKALIDAKELSIKVVHGRMVLKLRSKVLFGSGKARLRNYGKQTLKHVAKALKKIKDRHFQVAGHTDNKPILKSKFASNWELSAARSVEVVKFLLEQGVPGNQLSAAGFAEFQPVARNRSTWGRQRNRRIEITLLPSIPSQLLKEVKKGKRRRR